VNWDRNLDLGSGFTREGKRGVWCVDWEEIWMKDGGREMGGIWTWRTWGIGTWDEIGGV
jgi:hypothetical protein